MGKLKLIKRKLKDISVNKDDDDSETEVPKKVRHSDEPIPEKKKWINRQRLLIFAYRGISFRDRHLMKDLRTLFPHSKPESKMERKDNLFVLNEICEMKHCNKCILFEGRLKRDLYMWVSNVPDGPSVKFHVENVYTMGELKFTGNCLRGSRPLLSFDKNFTNEPHYSLIKELLVQTFGTPHYHPKSQPFTDHVMTFTVLDNRIWFRNYQILSEDGGLTEIGPRMVLNPIKIFESSFVGETLWQNPEYRTPAVYRRQMKDVTETKYENRVKSKLKFKERMLNGQSFKLNPVDEVFADDPLAQANEIEKRKLDYKTLIEGKEKKKKRKEAEEKEPVKKKKKKRLPPFIYKRLQRKKKKKNKKKNIKRKSKTAVLQY